MRRVYFDHAATTPVDPRVVERMLPLFGEVFGNPSEVHQEGRRAAEALQRARDQVATALGADADEIIFTGGGTEADNLALFGLLQGLEPGHLIVSAIEHPAVLEAARALVALGWRLDLVPVDEYGTVDLDAYEAAFCGTTRLASVMYANNVVGTVQPVAELARIAHEHGALFHTDAVQAVGALPIDVRELDVDLLSLSAHKFSGPKGVGALYVRRGVDLSPILHGGGQERRVRSGTENTPGIVGLGAALELAVAEMDLARPRLTALRDSLVRGVMASVPEVQLLGHPTQRLPGTATFTVRFIEGEAMVLDLDTRGFAVASGSACATGSFEPSYVALALGVQEAHSSLRLSLGRHNTQAEVDAFLEVFPAVVERLRRISPLYRER